MPLKTKIAILSLCALAWAGAAAVDVYEPRLSPDVVVINDYLTRAPARCVRALSLYRRWTEEVINVKTNTYGAIPSVAITNANGSVSYKPDWSRTNYLERVFVTTNIHYRSVYVFDEEAFRVAGPSSMDETIHTAISNGVISALSYARLMYGDAAVRQVVRAALERGEQYIESPYTTASVCLYNPSNIPVPMPGARKVPFAIAGAKLPRNGLSDTIPIAGSCFGSNNTNAIERLLMGSFYALRGYAMSPEAVAAAASLDAAGRSYAIPTVGVAIHTPADYAHEFAHFANPTRSLPAETAASTGFSQETLNACTTWKEFLPAFHALKVDAWSRDIDLGVPGGWAAYWAIVGASVETIAALQGEMSADGVALLAAYREAKAAEGTGNDNPDYARLRAWCESASIGRMVL